jgi:hypothetical protein
MRLAATIQIALYVAALSPTAANASESIAHKHRTHMHQTVDGSFNPAATALALPLAIVPATRTLKSDDDSDGLTRDSDQCNRGCIDN